MAAPLKVGLAGLGTVGASVLRLIDRQRDVLALRCGRPIEIVAVSARSLSIRRTTEAPTVPRPARPTLRGATMARPLLFWAGNDGIAAKGAAKAEI